MTQQLLANQMIPESGIYRVNHEPSDHPGSRNMVTFIRGRRFPACPHCATVTFELVYSDEGYWRQRAAEKQRRRRLRAAWLRPHACIRSALSQPVLSERVARVIAALAATRLRRLATTSTTSSLSLNATK